MKNLWTTIFGVLAAVPVILHSQGVSIGHVAGVDWLTLIQGIATGGLGVMAADKNNPVLKQ